MSNYNKFSQPASTHKIFNNWNIITKGWYIAMPCKDLKINSAKSITIGKQRIVFFRGKSGNVYALDAFCPHMGADLGLGKVIGENIQCLFHNWQYNNLGQCKNIPCGESIPSHIKLAYYATEEKYGFVWIWPDHTADTPVPYISTLEHQNLICVTGEPYIRSCHYHITMINGIDAQHLNSVHSLPVTMQPEISEPQTNFFHVKMSGFFKSDTKKNKLICWLMGGNYCYSMLYTYGTIGFLTIMGNVKLFGKFKFPELHMLYAYTPLANNTTKVTPIYFTINRKGFTGKIKSTFLLYLTKKLFYFLKEEDGQIYENIKFNTGSLLKIDKPIAQYITYINKLRPSSWSCE